MKKCFLFLLISWTALAGSGDDAAIWRPRFATPAIVALDSPANRQFTAEVRAPATTTGWSITLSNDLKAWPGEIVAAVYSNINRGTERGWQLKLRVPANISPELFGLTIRSTAGISMQSQAVSVAPDFTNDFYILHIADEQIVNELHTDPSGQYWHMVGTAEEMKWMQEPVNLIHPRLVFITGDQIDFNGALDAWNNWANWGYKPSGKRTFTREETIAIETRLSELYKECHAGYRVPYVEAPGNHDVAPANKLLAGSTNHWHPISTSIYEAQFGQCSWSLRMGDFYVLMHDWSDRELKQWAAADYRASLKDPAVKFRLVGQHFITDQAFIPGICDLMLVGHGHTHAVLQTTPYYTYEDGPAFCYGTTAFYNYRRENGAWRCDQTRTERDIARDLWPLFTDNGETKKVRCDQPDPMNITTRSVTISNDLPQNFYDGRLRFILPRGTYHSPNATVLAQYDFANNTKTAVLLKVNIPANGSVTVAIAEN